MSVNERLAILGSGIMGHSIALAAAWSGFQIKVWGTSEEDIARGREGIADKLKVLADYEVISQQDRQTILSRVAFTLSFEDCISGATFVIEAVPEILSLKQEWFKKLDKQCPVNVVIASNTSGLSPTSIAQFTAHPERTIVTHFWNPAHLIPLVEVVRGEKTSQDTIERSLNLLNHMHKKPILVKKDVLGSIGNRLQYALFREAQHLLEHEVASMEDIDAAVRYSLGRRLPVTGPFMTADMGGLDVFDSISNYLFRDLSTAKESLPFMRRLVDEGRFGQKTGEGFYNWSQESIKRMNEQRERELIYWIKKDLESPPQH